MCALVHHFRKRGGVYFVSVNYDATTESTGAILVNFFETKRRGSAKMRKFQTAVYRPRMAPIGAKLWENTFQTICNVSFFDAERKIVDVFPKQIGVKSIDRFSGGATMV